MSEIHEAVEEGLLERVIEILAEDPSQVHARTSGLVPDNQPLHYAAWHDQKTIAERLLDAGAEIDSRGDCGRTPLYYAVEHNSQSVIELLIDRGADLNARSVFECTPLYLAASVGDVEIAEVLLRGGAERDVNSSLYLDGAGEVLSILQADPTILQEMDRPETLLTDAIRIESPELAEFLLAHGVNPNLPGWSKLAPLFDAIATRNADLVRTILRHGAAVDVRDHIGQPVLSYAKRFRAGDEIMSLLKHHGAT